MIVCRIHARRGVATAPSYHEEAMKQQEHITAERIHAAIVKLAQIHKIDPHPAHYCLLERLEKEYAARTEDPFSKYL